MEFKPYNKKAFLLPDSINSMAAYHAKLFPDGKYVFRIHDCLSGIRLTGELKQESDFLDAFQKAIELSSGLMDFAAHVEGLRLEFFQVNEDDGSKLKLTDRDISEIRKCVLFEATR